jgi:hypothetical protein
MGEKRTTIGKKLVRAGGWQLVKRGAKALPLGGTLIVVTLVGSDIRRKGLIRGLVNSGLDALPVIGLAKNAVELVRGDLIPDKQENMER